MFYIEGPLIDSMSACSFPPSMDSLYLGPVASSFPYPVNPFFVPSFCSARDVLAGSGFFPHPSVNDYHLLHWRAVAFPEKDVA
jgi:hypothetical protein